MSGVCVVMVVVIVAVIVTVTAIETATVIVIVRETVIVTVSVSVTVVVAVTVVVVETLRGCVTLRVTSSHYRITSYHSNLYELEPNLELCPELILRMKYHFYFLPSLSVVCGDRNYL